VRLSGVTDCTISFSFFRLCSWLIQTW